MGYVPGVRFSRPGAKPKVPWVVVHAIEDLNRLFGGVTVLLCCLEVVNTYFKIGCGLCD